MTPLPPIRSHVYFIQCLNPNSGKVSSPPPPPGPGAFLSTCSALLSSPLTPHSFKPPPTPALMGSVPWPQLPGLFDVGHVTEQLYQAGILEAVCTRSANFPVRVPFQAFLAR